MKGGDLQILIPTYRRPRAQFTWEGLPDDWREEVTFVVDDVDAEWMADRAEFKPAQFLVVPEDEEIATIADKRAWLMRTLGYRRIVMFDDDLRFAVRKSPEETRLVPATRAQVGEHLTELFEVLNEFAHAGWSARQGNNRLDYGWVENTRMTYVLGYRLDLIEKAEVQLGRIQTREDMDYTLQLLRAGYENRVSSKICADQKYNAPGGASLERTQERSNADAELLAQLHPGLVRVTEKAYKSSLPRKEVVCSWKKALKQGLELCG